MNVICLAKSLFLRSGSSIISSLLKSGLGLDTLIEIEAGMLLSDWFDQLLSGKILDQSSSDRTTDLEFLAENGSGDAKNLWDLLDHSLVLLLIQEYGIVKLLLNLGFCPGLLLGLSATFTGSSFL